MLSILVLHVIDLDRFLKSEILYEAVYIGLTLWHGSTINKWLVSQFFIFLVWLINIIYFVQFCIYDFYSQNKGNIFMHTVISHNISLKRNFFYFCHLDKKKLLWRIFFLFKHEKKYWKLHSLSHFYDFTVTVIVKLL